MGLYDEVSKITNLIHAFHQTLRLRYDMLALKRGVKTMHSCVICIRGRICFRHIGILYASVYGYLVACSCMVGFAD